MRAISGRFTTTPPACAGVAAGDDVVQETFLAVLRQGGRFDPAKGTVPAYLYGIARHHVIKRLDRDGVALSEPSSSWHPMRSPRRTRHSKQWRVSA
jgi:RNA polymerase sigma-70 factor (ECF subfamily)